MSPKPPLWAPWRMAWIEGADPSAPPREGCFLCDAVERSEPLLLWHDDLVLAILNRFPYNPGHLMLAPRVHRADLEAFPDALAARLDGLLRASLRILKQSLGAPGYNVGMNLGAAAGAGVPDHLHVHVVPRWEGDNNFMPVLADVRVIPEHLERSTSRLRAAFVEELGECVH